MKWRIIINMSLAGDRGSVLGNEIKKCLKQCGIMPIKHNSHSWEGGAVSPVEAAKQLTTVIGCLADHSEKNGRSQLDNMLIYIDRAKN